MCAHPDTHKWKEILLNKSIMAQWQCYCSASFCGVSPEQSFNTWALPGSIPHSQEAKHTLSSPPSAGSLWQHEMESCTWLPHHSHEWAAWDYQGTVMTDDSGEGGTVVKWHHCNLQTIVPEDNGTLACCQFILLTTKRKFVDSVKLIELNS